MEWDKKAIYYGDKATLKIKSFELSDESPSCKLQLWEKDYTTEDDFILEQDITIDSDEVETEIEFNFDLDKVLDEEIDGELVKLSKEDENIVIDSRMAWHFVEGSFKVHLLVDAKLAAERIVKDFEGKISDADKTKLEEQRKAMVNECYLKETDGIYKIELEFKDGNEYKYISSYDLLLENSKVMFYDNDENQSEITYEIIPDYYLEVLSQKNPSKIFQKQPKWNVFKEAWNNSSQGNQWTFEEGFFPESMVLNNNFVKMTSRNFYLIEKPDKNIN